MTEAVDKIARMFYLCSMTGIHIIWFREDLRVHDHAALKAASLASARDEGSLVALYTFSESAPATAFQVGALRDLEHALEQRGARLHYRSGEPITHLSELHTSHKILSLQAHEAKSFRTADQKVEAWSMRAGIPFRLHEQFGFVARHSRDSGRWADFMAQPRHEAPDDFTSANVGLGQKPTVPISDRDRDNARPGGRKAAITILRQILGRVSDLSQVASTADLTSDTAFETLAPHLDLGVLSVRETWQAAISAQQQYAKAGQDIRAAQVAGLIDHLHQYAIAQRIERPAAAPRQPINARRSGDAPTSQLSLDLFAAMPNNTGASPIISKDFSEKQ